jgi:hypothetical protein
MFSRGKFHNPGSAIRKMPLRSALWPLAATVLILGVGVPARADDAKTGLRDACREDYKKLCGSVTPGGGRIKQCMKDNAANLSERCRAAILQQKAAMDAQKK